jgi:hypothetical protein
MDDAAGMRIRQGGGEGGDQAGRGLGRQAAAGGPLAFQEFVERLAL